MIYLRLGDPNAFPFVERPNPKNVKDGYEALQELGAATGSGREAELTPLGRRMAPIPLDPRISRMLLEAHREKCVEEVAIIASALSIRDPRERPPDKAALADQAQAGFAHPDSDFLTLLNIWRQYHGAPGSPLSASRQRRFCHERFLSHGRMREWGFVHDQILSILEEQGFPAGPAERREISPPFMPPSTAPSSRASSRTSRSTRKRASTRRPRAGRSCSSRARRCSGKRGPGSSPPRSSRHRASTPGWPPGSMPRGSRNSEANSARYSYSEPRWDMDRGEVRAKERVTLYGLEIVKDRDVAYGPKNPDEAHKDFRRPGARRGPGQGPARVPPAQPGTPEQGRRHGGEAQAAQHHGRRADDRRLLFPPARRGVRPPRPRRSGSRRWEATVS